MYCLKIMQSSMVGVLPTYITSMDSDGDSSPSKQAEKWTVTVGVNGISEAWRIQYNSCANKKHISLGGFRAHLGIKVSFPAEMVVSPIILRLHLHALYLLLSSVTLSSAAFYFAPICLSSFFSSSVFSSKPLHHCSY